MEKKRINKGDRIHRIAARLNEKELTNLKLVPGNDITNRIVFLINYFHRSNPLVTEINSDGSGVLSQEGDEIVSC